MCAARSDNAPHNSRFAADRAIACFSSFFVPACLDAYSRRGAEGGSYET